MKIRRHCYWNYIHAKQLISDGCKHYAWFYCGGNTWDKLSGSTEEEGYSESTTNTDVAGLQRISYVSSLWFKLQQSTGTCFASCKIWMVWKVEPVMAHWLIFSMKLNLYWNDKEGNVPRRALGLAQVYLHKTAGTMRRGAFFICSVHSVLPKFSVEPRPNPSHNVHTLFGFLLARYEEDSSLV